MEVIKYNINSIEPWSLTKWKNIFYVSKNPILKNNFLFFIIDEPMIEPFHRRRSMPIKKE